MKHARRDYDAIQPWPTQRPHIARIKGQAVWNADPARAEPLIPDDEPVLLLRAQDMLAPFVLRQYAEMLDDVGAAPELIEAIRQHAAAMHDWQRDHDVLAKIPDAPPWALEAK